MYLIYRAFCLTCLLLANNAALAAEETYLREYVYQASDVDSKITARAIALQEVKRILLSELGTHVSSLVKQQSSSDGKHLGSEQIETLSAGVTRVEILAEKWDGSTYVLKAQIKADPADVLRSLEKMLDADKKQKQVSQLGGELDKMRGENLKMSESLMQSRKAADDAMAEITRLKQQLKEKQTDAQRQALLAQYEEQTQQLTLQELFDAALEKYKAAEFLAAVQLWRKAAEQGYAKAQSSLGAMYEYGQGVPQDFKLAVSWYRKAAGQGYAFAQFNLGLNYFKGQGVPQDFKKAAYWWHKAAEQGHANAQYNLGQAYSIGQGVTKDFNQAVSWYRKAAEQGHVAALSNLGLKYANGQGVPQDKKQAISLFRKAAEYDNAPAQFNLGLMYANGQGVPQDYKQAVYWYRKAAEQGITSAQNNLGWMYTKSQGVPQDYKQAVYWYRKAAEQGEVNAQSNLGEMYEKGMGVPQNFKQAVYWYRKAAEQGDEDAIKVLRELQRR